MLGAGSGPAPQPRCKEGRKQQKEKSKRKQSSLEKIEIRCNLAPGTFKCDASQREFVTDGQDDPRRTHKQQRLRVTRGNPADASKGDQKA